MGHCGVAVQGHPEEDPRVLRRGGEAALRVRYRDHPRAAVNGLENRFPGLTGWVKGIPGKIKSFFGAAGSWLYAAGKAILTGLLNGLLSAWNAR